MLIILNYLLFFGALGTLEELETIAALGELGTLIDLEEFGALEELEATEALGLLKEFGFLYV